MPGLTIRATDNIDGVQWGKLLVNLNNALNALSDLPLRRQLARGHGGNCSPISWRKALAAIRAEGIRPVSPTPIPPAWMPPLLRLPNVIFELLLGRTMKIDPEARSSMWEDLKHGRRTEIDYLQGVITEIAGRRGLQAPLSRRIVELIRQAERDASGSPGLSPAQVRCELIGSASTARPRVAPSSTDRTCGREKRNETNRSGIDGDYSCRLGVIDTCPGGAADGNAVTGL